MVCITHVTRRHSSATATLAFAFTIHRLTCSHSFSLRRFHTVETFALSNVLVAQPAISDPDELGTSLATECFSQAQLSIDAKLGIDGEF